MENVGHVFCQIFNRDVFGWFACKIYCLPCSRQPSTLSIIPCNWTHFRRRQQQPWWSLGTLV